MGLIISMGTHRRHGIGHSTNLVGRSSAWVASCGFNDKPSSLHIWGVREMNSSLFEMLDQAINLYDAAEAFTSYMSAMFSIEPEQCDQADKKGRRRFRSSFLRLITGWSFDSNGPEAAVLKGWVESRFGIGPTFHKTIIDHVSTRAWTTYVEEKMSSGFHNNAIWVQLDLLFEFCQWAIDRFAYLGETHLTLYRGINFLDEHWFVERPSKREGVIRLNNLVSFTTDREVAGCFGDAILTTRVPVNKIIFFNGLLPSHLLKSESEHLAIGGDYRVSIDYV